MNLAFNVSGSGPLSQIGIHLIGFDTAVYLATGAIGWWKSRSRSLSLIESLSASKASLVCCSNFNLLSYQERRKQTGRIMGLAVQNDELRAIPGEIAQTAVSNDPGIDCLRALTTGLLCFYDVQKVTALLADVIPVGMLHPEHDDEVPEFDGPLLSSLRNWVESVAKEEDCNSYRAHLLGLVTKAQDALIGGQLPRSAVLDHSSDDTNHLLGALRWMVTPRHRRDVPVYPTRSLYVWRTAVVMSELAFDISVSSELIHTTSQYQQFTGSTGTYADIALVVASVGDTDPLMLAQVHTESLRLRPQVTPIRSIPHVAFGHVALGDRLNVTPEELVEIWNISFGYAKEGVEVPYLSRGGNVHLPVRRDMELLRDSHKPLVSIWSPHLARLLRPAMDLFVPASSRDPAWSQTGIKEYLDRQGNGDPVYYEDNEVRGNLLKLSAIILGTIYGACFKSITPMVPVDADKGPSEFLEVALSPENALDARLFRWASTLGLALSGLLESSKWTGLLLELTTGMEHPTPLDEQPSAGLLNRRLNLTSAGATPGLFHDFHVRVSDIFGAQANGVFAISEFIVRPSTHANAALRFHVGTGRILNLPVDDAGYIRESQVAVGSLELPLDPEPSMDLLSRQPGAVSTTHLGFRIDAEPDWSGNAQHIRFGVRSAGVLVSTLRISRVLERLANDLVACKCGEPQAPVQVPLSERWQAVSVYQILRPSYPGSSELSAFIRDEDKILVDVEGDDVKRMLVVGMLSCRKVAICVDCVGCAYKALRDKEKTQSVALVVG
ncbi:hypothetical protein BDW74DRAFT_183843 [Aspergillus multicolor]|uniref:uncharacterized protein n=1 Tax=Aspergillus multicolor TaxID=41759 RepID=UPI003CCDD1DE